MEFFNFYMKFEICQHEPFFIFIDMARSNKFVDILAAAEWRFTRIFARIYTHIYEMKNKYSEINVIYC